MQQQSISSEELEKWASGFFDSDGSVANSVKDNEIMPTCTINQYSPSFIAGLFDGDGSVVADCKKNKRASLGYYTNSEVCFQQTGCSAADAMVCLALFCEKNDIMYNINESISNKSNHKNGYQFRLTSRQDVRLFLEMIKEHSVVKREQIVIMLERIMPLLEDGVHLNKDGFLRVMYWVDELDSMKGGTRGKYDLEYFEELWDRELDRSVLSDYPEETEKERRNSL